MRNLEGEPAAQHIDRRNAQGQSHEEQNPDAGARIEQHIGGQDAADGARSADQGRVGTGGKQRMNSAAPIPHER